MSTDRLVDALWGECPPPAAVKTVQTYVSQLRKALGDGVVATRGHAYVLERDAGSVDAERFGALAPMAASYSTPERPAGRRTGCARRWSCGVARRWRTSPTRRSRQQEIARLEELRTARPRIGSRPRSRPGGRASWSPSSRRWRASTRYASGCAAS